uniref:Uncharacterized protein n=1 Tax=Anguilla anguilla TaxID=7936 RepID=A0A0E9UZQ4_ANGAN
MPNSRRGGEKRKENAST